MREEALESGVGDPEVSNVPPELLEFLGLGHKMLLIQGAPGTGKTILAFELLCKEGGCGVYVTTQVSIEELRSQYPWACGAIPENNLIDATKMEVSAHASELVQAPEEYFKLPEPIKRAYEVAARSCYPSIVIFDSWDAMVDRFERAEKLSGEPWTKREVEALLVDAFSAQDADVIMVSKKLGIENLDYLVDGIVLLNKKLKNGHILREMIIDKLRGAEIKRPRYLITLEGGRFRYIPPFQHEVVSMPFGPKPISDPSALRISSGIPDFDRLLGGGYRKGTVNIFEVGEWAGYSYIHLAIPTAINTAMLGRGHYIVAGGNVDIRAAEEICIKSLGEAKCRESLATLFMGRKVPLEHPYLVKAGMESVDEDINLVEQHIEEKTGMPAEFAILAFDTLEHIYSFDDLKRFMSIHSNEVRRTDRVEFWMVRDWQRELIDHVRVMASTRWRLFGINGAVLLRGQRPDTAFHALELGVKDGYRSVHLTPIS